MLFLITTILLTANAASEPIKYKQKDRIHLGAQLSCGNEGYTQFYPKLNKLAMLRIPVKSNIKDCNIRFFSVDNPLINTTNKYPLTKTEGGDTYAVEFLSLILFFEKGVNTAISWDTSFDTNSCKIRHPINKTCSITYKSDSYEYIKVFAASVGTDKDNIPLTSAQNLPSTFVKFGVGGVIDDATKFVNKAAGWFK